MKKTMKTARYACYIALFLGTVWVSSMGYSQVVAERSERSLDLATWLSKKQVTRLMRFHGTDILKVTSEEVFIPRGSEWVLVLRRDQD